MVAENVAIFLQLNLLESSFQFVYVSLMFLQLFLFNLKQKYKSSIYGLSFEVRMQYSPADKQGVFLFVWWGFFKNLFPVQILGFIYFFLCLQCKEGEDMYQCT